MDFETQHWRCFESITLCLQDQLRRVGQISSAMEARLHEEGRVAGQAQAAAQIKALQQARAEAQAAAQHQIQALLQERDDLQVRLWAAEVWSKRMVMKSLNCDN